MIRALTICLMITVAPPLLRAGDTLRVGASSHIKSIKAGILQAEKGDVLLIEKGFYTEGTILIDKSITIMGVDRPIIDGENKHEILQIAADSVFITGLQIQNVGVSYTRDFAGISVEKVSDCVIDDNILLNTFFGIYLKNAKNCRIINNRIVGQAAKEISSGNAIHLWYCKNIEVSNNKVNKHRDGIYLEFVDSTLISHNLSEHNLRYGLHFMFSNHDNYIGNTFKNNGAGVAVMFSKQIQMIDNNFLNNWGTASYGLLLKEIYDGKIEGNTFSMNTIGMYGESATRISIIHNDFKQNGWAVKFLGSSMDNEFTYNNFIGNTFDLTTDSGRNNNRYIHNYWSKYTGYDLDKDGYGDVPYRPMKLFSYIINKSSSSIILLRSFFMDLINFAEKVTPVFTPATLVDNSPLIKPYHD